MTKRLFLLASVLALVAFAAGSVQQTTSQLGSTNEWVVAFQWTGDATTGTVPITVADLPGQLQGYLFTHVQVIPRTPAPTTGYSVAVQDTGGVDVLAGAAASCSATVPQTYAASASAAPLNGSFSLVITGNSVASARGTVLVYLAKPGTINVAALRSASLGANAVLGAGSLTIAGALPYVTATAGTVASEAAFAYNSAINMLTVDNVDASLYDRGGAECNVKNLFWGAKGDGLTDDTVAIQSALSDCAGKVVYLPPGEYNVHCDAACVTAGGSLIPSVSTVIRGPGTTMNNSVYTTRIQYFGADTPLFHVKYSGVKISGMWLYQSPTVTPVSGDIGIKITGQPPGAISATVENMQVTNFYDGIDAQGGGGQTNLTDVTSQSNLHDGFISRYCQGLWHNVNGIANGRHGFYITSAPAGSSPWLIGGGTFGNGGWGIYADATITGIDGMFLNNDSLGEIKLDFTAADSGIITNTVAQWAGWNMYTQGLNPSDTTNMFTGPQLSRQVIAATNANPIEITVGAAHGMTGPISVDCSRLAGNTAGNGTFTATPVVGQPTKFTINAIGNGALVVPGTCPTGGLYDNFCPKCSRSADTYRTIADSPSVSLGSGVAALVMSGNKLFGPNGNNIESDAPSLSLVNNVVLGGGGGGTTTDIFGLKLAGSFSQIADNMTTSASQITGNQNSITGNRFSCSTTPACLDLPSGDDLVFANNRVYNNTGGAAPGIDIGATTKVIPARNMVVGTVVNAGQPSSDMYPKYLYSYPVTFANLPTGSDAYDGTIQACSDCQVTSSADNTCKAGGVGATANRINGVWRCFWNTGSGSGTGDVLGASNLTTAGYPVVVDSAGTATQTPILGSAVGGTGNGFAKFAGPATAEKTFTLPDANSTILTTNAAVTVAQGGTGVASGTSGGVPYFDSATTMASSAALAQYKLLVGGGAGAAPATLASAGTAGQYLVSGGAAANPSWASLAGPSCATYTVAYSNAAFIVAAGTNDVTLAALPAKGKVTGCTVKHSAQFTDGAGAMSQVTASLGDGTTHTAYCAAQGIGEATAVADTAFTDGPSTGYKSTTMAASNLVVHFTATGRNFGDGAATFLTAGSVAVSVCTVTLP